MIFLLRLLRGYVVLVVSGSRPERFVNICVRNGVDVWGIRSREGIIYCRVFAVSFKTIRRLCRSRGFKVRVRRKVGLPFFCYRNRRRVGLLAGTACFLIIVNVLSLFVWNIDIYGQRTISDYQAARVMEEVGIYEGMYGGVGSLKSIEINAMRRFGGISWLTVNIDGTSGEVNISESYEKGDIVDETSPQNIKAACDAQIIRVDAYSGSAAVKSGDAVLSGGLLISGVLESEEGAVSFVRADGVVWAKTYHTETFAVPKQVSYLSYDEKCADRYSARLFGVTIPLTAAFTSGDTLSFYTEDKAQFHGSAASVSLITEKLYSYEYVWEEITMRDSERIYETLRAVKELFSCSTRLIDSADVQLTETADEYIYTVTYVCEEDIAESSPIYVER